MKFSSPGATRPLAGDSVFPTDGNTASPMVGTIDNNMCNNRLGRPALIDEDVLLSS